MIKKKIGVLMAGLMMLGLLQACGGGGGGGSDSNIVPVTDANTTPVVAAGDVTYEVAMPTSEYTYTISGFGAGDKLVFPLGTTATVWNADATDGMTIVQYAVAEGKIAKIALTGYTAQEDTTQLNSIEELNAKFGEGTISYK
jgi:ABC-type proline/glycine betaine transport system substrate-binding protein